MKYVFTVLIAVVALILLAAPATADWDPGQPYKYVQMPDRDGWDVDFTESPGAWPIRLADDFPCYRQGPITDVHLWFSVQGEFLRDALGDTLPVEAAIEKIHLSIHDNIPADPLNNIPYSRPTQGPPRWQRDFDAQDPSSVSIRPVDSGDQGFIWVYEGGDFTWEDKPDHQTIWQANILIDPRDAFVQEGSSTNQKIYWLDASMTLKPGVIGNVGWKTSLDGFNPPELDDDAVFGWEDPGPSPPEVVQWYELRDPYDNEKSLNLAFVITPEPGTVAMLIGAGLIGLVAFARRRRKS